jgi:hypothetical protein
MTSPSDVVLSEDLVASPAPWTMRLNKAETSYGIWDAQGRYLAGGSWNESGQSFPNKAESEVNLRQMAAAPELLAAANAVLANCMPIFPDSRAVDDCLVQLAAAVVKAESP